MINIFRIAWFSAIRQIRRASRWTTVLTIFIMAITFLNLVLVSGILVGLIDGAIEASREHYSGDILISAGSDESYIVETREILSLANSLPEITALSARYSESGVIEANYRNQSDPSRLPDTAGALMVGINPEHEESLSQLSKFVVEGEYLSIDDDGEVLVGSNLLKRYLNVENDQFETIENVIVGSKVRVKINGFTKEVTVKGIVDSKVDEISRRVFFVDRELRQLIGRTDFNVDEIAIRIDTDKISPEMVRDIFISTGASDGALVQTWNEAQGSFIDDIKNTFGILGTALGSLALIVAAITIFIVIFINALNRRKFIGIQKAIGISSKAIILSYVFQAMFYAIIGVAISSVFIFAYLEPFFRRNPIDFPFSDGILSVSVSGTVIRIIILLITTFIAGYLPAKLIVNDNTLDSILGR
jgi:putative ABC transport system permease protein